MGLIVAALVADYVDKSHHRHLTRVVRLEKRVHMFMRIARLGCAAASVHFEPDELIDLQGVQILQLIVFSVTTDTWGRDIPPLHHLGWMATYHEAARAWLQAEHRGLESSSRGALRTLVRRFGWRWDPHTQGGWFWELAERFRVQEPPMQHIPLPKPPGGAK